MHTGDLYWNGLYPVIDASSGGSAAGMIQGVEAILQRIDDDTRVIPGHGPLSDKAGMQAYLAMLKASYERIKALRDAGKTLEEAVAARPTAEFDERWGAAFLNPEQWANMVWTTLDQ